MSDPVDTDALRKTADELDGSDFRVVREAGDVLDAAADEVDRLRVVIENAPHVDGCGHVDWGADGLLRLGRCTCWKADAL